MEINRFKKFAVALDRFVHIFQVFLYVATFLVVASGIGLFTTSGKILERGHLSVQLDHVTFALKDNIASKNEYLYYLLSILLSSLVVIIILIIGLKIVRNILSPMTQGRPFEKEISKNITKLGFLILIGGAINQCLGIYQQYNSVKVLKLADIVSNNFSFESINYGMNLRFVLVAVIILFLGKVFRYGEVLQQESDETL